MSLPPANPRRLVRLMRQAALTLLFAASACLPAVAADGTLLIQSVNGGKFRVWKTDGETRLDENQLLILESTAAPGGGPPLTTPHGPASAHETADGIIVELPTAAHDKTLLLDHDACSAIKAWHIADDTGLSDEQITDIFLSAASDGGKNLLVGNRLAKAYTTRLGVKAVFWTPLRKPAPK